MKNFLSMLYPEKTWLRILLMGAPILVILASVGAIALSILVPEEEPDLLADVYATAPTPQDTPPATLPTPPITDPYHSTRWDLAEDLIDHRPLAILTGRPIEPEYLNRRPIAVVINNIHQALPQSGVTQADIIYEVLSEGDVTRLVGIFQSYIPEKIGPVRSARDSFIDFAYNHDSIFIHHGTSPDAIQRLRSTGIQNIDGMAWEGSVFWRDRSYPEWHHHSGNRPLEHSSYTSGERIAAHLAQRNIRPHITASELNSEELDSEALALTDLNPNEAPIATPAARYGFHFGPIQPSLWENAQPAHRVVVPFSAGYPRTFTFDPTINAYWVENRDGPHVDAENAQQVYVTNVLIQLTTMRVTGSLGQRTITTVGQGDGFFASGGYYKPVRWAKDSHQSPMRWYTIDGQPLTMAPGTTWINVHQGALVFDGPPQIPTDPTEPTQITEATGPSLPATHP